MRVRVATFNLENLDHRPDQKPSLDTRIEALRPALVRLDADVLCLQEVNAQGAKHRTLEALEALLVGTPHAGFERVATESDSGKPFRDVQNLVTLSHFPISSHEQLHHDLVKPPVYELATVADGSHDSREISWDRPILYTRHSLESETGIPDGTGLHIVNVRFRAPLAAHITGKKTGAFEWADAASWAEGFLLQV